jgi:predicted secreted acid phosphatase
LAISTVHHVKDLEKVAERISALPSTTAKMESNSTKFGNLVLILDPNQPRGQWLRGKIEETFPDYRNVVQ